MLSSNLHKAGDLPLDIKLETIISVSLACFGIVLGAEALKPISWSTWAGNIEKEGGHESLSGTGRARWDLLTSERRGKEFADWVRQQGKGEKQ